MTSDFLHSVWDARLEEDLRTLIALAVREDGGGRDLTSELLIPTDARGTAEVVSRAAGVFVGERAVPIILDAVRERVLGHNLCWFPARRDGETFASQESLGRLEGDVRTLLTAERLVLNLLGRLCGIATLTARYVAAVHGAARIYDTRKTTLGWRRLEKYAVRCGGGCNHRMGLDDAVLIKDNHIAFGASHQQFSLAEAVRHTRLQLSGTETIVEIEVDSLEQLREVLTAAPDIVLLDNMPPSLLRDAVAIKNALAPRVELEASGGVTLDTIAEIATTGVDRISVGALTHSATTLDLGLDWKSR